MSIQHTNDTFQDELKHEWVKNGLIKITLRHLITPL